MQHAIVNQAVFVGSPGLHTRNHLPFQSYAVRSSSVAETNAFLSAQACGLCSSCSAQHLLMQLTENLPQMLFGSLTSQ